MVEAAEVTVAKVEPSSPFREVISPLEVARGSMVVDVSVTILPEITFPDGSLVTSFTLVTVLCAGATVTSAMGEDVGDGERPRAVRIERISDVAAAAFVVEVVDDVVVVLDVLELRVGVIVTVDGVAETVTVSIEASRFALAACGMTKLGAMLIEGCCSAGLQTAVAVPGPAHGKSRDGALLYRPMMVYAKRIVLSKARMMAKTMKSGMGIVTPDLRVRGGGP